MKKIHTVVVERNGESKSIHLSGMYDIYDIAGMLHTITGNHWIVCVSQGVANVCEKHTERAGI